MYFIGADPDLHKTSFASVDETGKVLDARCIKSAGSTGRDAVIDMIQALYRSAASLRRCPLAAVAVESQETVYTARSGRNPRDLMMLANISGAILMGYCFMSPATQQYLPAPQAWKGSVPKQIHQARICSRLGWKFERAGTVQAGYCYPTEITYPGINKSDWKHVLDAIGLAQYAREEWLLQQKRAASKVSQPPSP